MSLEETLKLMEKTELVSLEDSLFPGGGLVWLPRGMKWKNLVYKQFYEILELAGFEEMQLPRIVSSTTLDKVAEDFFDFRNGVYWLNDNEGRDRDKRYLNSTSDPVLNHFLSKKVKQNPKMIPMDIYLKEHLFRPVTGGVPFLRQEEHSGIIESYSLVWDEESLNNAFTKSREMLKRFFDGLNLSYLEIDQSMWGNKPVAKEVTSLQTLIPSLKGMARIGTTYKHHERFSRIFRVRRKDKNGRNEYAKQVGFGFGERFLLGLLEHHVDSYGFCFTSNTAPTQIAIISNDSSDRSKVEDLKEKLKKYRISIDEDYSSHIKKRLKKHLVYGTPLRVTITSDNNLLYSRRDTLDRTECSIDYFVSHLDNILQDVDNSLRYRSQEFFNGNLVQTNSLAEIDSILYNNKVVLINHCLQESFGQALEDKYPGELLGKVLTKNIRNDAPCVLCKIEKGYISAYAKRAPNP